MSKLVDFDKAKKEAELKKRQQKKVKQTNEKLLNKMKKSDQGKKFKVIYFYGALILIIAVFVVISKIQL